MTQLETKAHPEQTYRGHLGLPNLSRAYLRERLETACRIANNAGPLRVKQVKSILQSNRDPLPEPLDLNAEPPQNHENIRGPRTVH